MADSSSRNSKYLGVFNCVVKIPVHCPELHNYTSDVWFYAAIVWLFWTKSWHLLSLFQKFTLIFIFAVKEKLLSVSTSLLTLMMGSLRDEELNYHLNHHHQPRKQETRNPRAQLYSPLPHCNLAKSYAPASAYSHSKDENSCSRLLRRIQWDAVWRHLETTYPRHLTLAHSSFELLALALEAVYPQAPCSAFIRAVPLPFPPPLSINSRKQQVGDAVPTRALCDLSEQQSACPAGWYCLLLTSVSSHFNHSQW